jgi:hypothetical protein
MSPLYVNAIFFESGDILTSRSHNGVMAEACITAAAASIVSKFLIMTGILSVIIGVKMVNWQES